MHFKEGSTHMCKPNLTLLKITFNIMNNVGHRTHDGSKFNSRPRTAGLLLCTEYLKEQLNHKVGQ